MKLVCVGLTEEPLAERNQPGEGTSAEGKAEENKGKRKDKAEEKGTNSAEARRIRQGKLTSTGVEE